MLSEYLHSKHSSIVCICKSRNLETPLHSATSQNHCKASMAPATRVLIACLVMAFAFQMYAEAAQAAESQSFGLQTNGIYRRLFQTIDCKTACSGRCKAASLSDRCMRACGTCCSRCKCVPPGTYGNKELCPCYANMKTHGNQPKCP